MSSLTRSGSDPSLNSKMPAAPVKLTDLPVELLAQIFTIASDGAEWPWGDDDGDGDGDDGGGVPTAREAVLLSLNLVSKMLHAIAQPLLYSRITLEVGSYPLLFSTLSFYRKTGGTPSSSSSSPGPSTMVQSLRWEKALRYSESQFRELLDLTPDLRELVISDPPVVDYILNDLSLRGSGVPGALVVGGLEMWKSLERFEWCFDQTSWSGGRVVDVKVLFELLDCKRRWYEDDQERKRRRRDEREGQAGEKGEERSAARLLRNLEIERLQSLDRRPLSDLPTFKHSTSFPGGLGLSSLTLSHPHLTPVDFVALMDSTFETLETLYLKYTTIQDYHVGTLNRALKNLRNLSSLSIQDTSSTDHDHDHDHVPGNALVTALRPNPPPAGRRCPLDYTLEECNFPNLRELELCGPLVSRDGLGRLPGGIRWLVVWNCPNVGAEDVVECLDRRRRSTGSEGKEGNEAGDEDHDDEEEGGYFHTWLPELRTLHLLEKMDWTIDGCREVVEGCRKRKVEVGGDVRLRNGGWQRLDLL